MAGAAKDARAQTTNVGLSVKNTGPGTGFRSEARGLSTTGTKVTVNSGSERKGLIGLLLSLSQSLFGWPK